MEIPEKVIGELSSKMKRKEKNEQLALYISLVNSLDNSLI